MDYAYTINGWLKGINMPSLDPSHDPGLDGHTTGANVGFARDAFGMILGYHEKDFVKSGSVYDSSHTTTSSWHVPNPTFLYNGNISSWAWNSRRASGATDTAMASVYHYDLLNRIRTDSTRLRGATAWSAVGSHWQSSYTYDGNGNIQTLYRANASGSQMDNLTYAYTSGTSKLINISDYQGASTGADIGDQDGNNYAYDATGNMTQDTAAGINAGGIVWSPYNKIKSITKMGDDTTSKLVYHYDATGNRILKRYYKPYNTLKSTTWYVRDAQGNTLATYTKPADSSTARQHEVMLYGSTRLAVAGTQAPYSDSETDTLGIFDRVSSRTLGEKRYELTDHLGNVRATVSDVVIDHSGDLDAELSTRTDYYPFGMIMGGRNSSADDAHRYGFNGKENDNEVKGEGGLQDYGERSYLAREARFITTDPLSSKYAPLSPYQFASLNPVYAIDLDGLEGVSYRVGRMNSEGDFTPTKRVIELDIYVAVGNNHPNAIQYPTGFSLAEYVAQTFNVGEQRDENNLPVEYRFNFRSIDASEHLGDQNRINTFTSGKNNAHMKMSTDMSTEFPGQQQPTFPYALVMMDNLPDADGNTTGPVIRLSTRPSHYSHGQREVHEIIHRLLQAAGKIVRAPNSMSEDDEHALGGAMRYGKEIATPSGEFDSFEYDPKINSRTHETIIQSVPRIEDKVEDGE